MRTEISQELELWLCVSCLQGTWPISHVHWLRKAQQENFLYPMPFLSFLLSRASYTWPHTFALPLLLWRPLSPRLSPTLWQGRSQAAWGAVHRNRIEGRLKMLGAVVPREELRFWFSREERWGPVFPRVTAQKTTKAKRKTPTLHG